MNEQIEKTRFTRTKDEIEKRETMLGSKIKFTLGSLVG